MFIQRSASVYVSDTAKFTRKDSHPFFAALLAACAVLMVFLGSVAFLGGSSPLTAHAQSTTTNPEDEKIKQAIRDQAQKEFMPPEVVEGEEPRTMTMFDFMDMPADEGSPTIAALRRLISIGEYMNDTSRAYVSSESNTTMKPGIMCNVNDPHAGTPLYHNCDIPNPMTEAIQNAVSSLGYTGLVNAEKSSSYMDIPEFGLPSATNDFKAPAQVDDAAVKYSALELFGYNLDYSSYYGEWDDIRVATSARLLSNFGMMDMIGLSAKSAFAGIVAGLDTGGRDFFNNLSDGDILGAIGGLFSGYDAGVGATIDTVLDTSDFNVISNYAWYREGYGSTLYNARELSNAEVAQNAMEKMVEMIMGTAPDSAKVPQELLDIQKGPSMPLEQISLCRFPNEDGEIRDAFPNLAAPGVTEETCAEEAAATQEVDIADAQYTYTVDGRQKEETLEEWYNRDSAFKIAAQYNLNCKPDFNGERNAQISQVMSCWDEGWNAARDAALVSAQEEENKNWSQETLSNENFAKWVQEDPSRNFNAPWNRFVCTDAQGDDILDDTGRPLKLFDPQGNKNPSCETPRPPIQNGFFGNGYVQVTEGGTKIDNLFAPGIDTRNTTNNITLFEVFVPIENVVNFFSQMFLNIAILFNRVSNTVINLSFMPIGEILGISDIVASLMEAFRDGIFFPLITLALAAVGVTMLYQAMVQRKVRQQISNGLLALVTGVMGVALLSQPKETIKAVEQIPASVEAGLMGAIFNFGSESDPLCSVSSPQMLTSSGTTTDFSGRSTGVVINESVRNLMCENWRAFSFNPWVMGQWGTSYENLFANGTPNVAGTLTNTNGDMVGSASVPMGGGVVANNWALYQLDLKSSGTAYTSAIDPKDAPGQVDKNFYRIVDAQAGPRSGEGRDSRYYEMWSGQQYISRLSASAIGALSSGVSSFIVISYSIAKIQITIVSTLMLIFLPFVMLMGILPGPGRRFMKGFGATLLGLMIQRLILVVLMSIMFKVMIGFANAGSNIFITAIMVMITAIVFYGFKKDAFREAFRISGGVGQHVGKRLVEDPSKLIKDGLGSSSFVSNTINSGKAGLRGGTGGALGSAIAGERTIQGIRDSIKEGARYEMSKVEKNQRRRGFSPMQSFTHSYSKVSDKIQKETERRINASNADATELRKPIWEGVELENPEDSNLPKRKRGTVIEGGSAEYAQYREDVKNYDSIKEQEYKNATDGRKFKYDPDANVSTAEKISGMREDAKIYAPKKPQIQVKSTREARAVNRYMEASKRLEESQKSEVIDNYDLSPSSAPTAEVISGRKVEAIQQTAERKDQIKKRYDAAEGVERQRGEGDLAVPVRPRTKKKRAGLAIAKVTRKQLSPDQIREQIKEEQERFLNSQEFRYLVSDILTGEKESYSTRLKDIERKNKKGGGTP